MTPEPVWVDLGLPSGLLWLNCNLGAVTPESAGLFFSWGNTDGHPLGGGYNFSQAVYEGTGGHDVATDLQPSEDPATVILGSSCHTPTTAEFQELNDNCASVWTEVNGIKGRLFTSNVNGKSIFIPARGYYSGTSNYGANELGDYWSSSFFSSTRARRMNFNNSSVTPNGDGDRYYGYPIRPVKTA